MTNNVKMSLAVISFVGALVIGFIALFLPPEGVIDSSVLWFSAQMLLFCSTLLGLSLNLGKWGKTETNKKEE